MSSFLIITDSKNKNPIQKESNINVNNNNYIYEFLKKELVNVGYNVFSKHFSFNTPLPIISKINEINLDYIIIDVPNRIKLSTLFKNLILNKDNVADFIIRKHLTATMIDKKVKLPYIVLFVDPISIDVRPNNIPVFVEDIIQKDISQNFILAKLAILIKRHGIDYFNKSRLQELTKIFNKTNIIIVEIDKNFNIKFMNKKGLYFFNINFATARNTNFFDILTNEEDYKKSLKYVFKYSIEEKKQNSFEFESIKTLMGKGDILINWLVEVCENKDKSIDSIIVVGYEITKQMKLGAELEKFAVNLVDENKKLSEEIKISEESKEIFKKEMGLAQKIQNGIIPKNFPKLAGAEIAATYVPMDAVGGDFYDVFKFENSFGAILTDVSGHGIPAALVTTMTKVLSHNSSRKIFSPKIFTQTLNNELNNFLVPGTFLTLFALHYDHSTKILRYTSGGHNPQILIKKSTLQAHLLKSTGPIVGVIPFAEYEEHSISNIENGDRLLIFTDGILESKNKDRELYGMIRIVESIKYHFNKPIGEFKDSILTDVANFSKGMPVEDDVSLLVIDFKN